MRQKPKETGQRVEEEGGVEEESAGDGIRRWWHRVVKRCGSGGRKTPWSRPPAACACQPLRCVPLAATQHVLMRGLLQKRPEGLRPCRCAHPKAQQPLQQRTRPWLQRTGRQRPCRPLGEPVYRLGLRPLRTIWSEWACYLGGPCEFFGSDAHRFCLRPLLDIWNDWVYYLGGPCLKISSDGVCDRDAP